MSLRYIIGGFGSGKTSRCISEIRMQSAKLLDQKLIYITPEQAALQTEKKLVNAMNNKVILNIEVLSFKRLAFYILAREGLYDKKNKILSDTGKHMLLIKVCLQFKDELLYYNKVYNKKGFVQGLLYTLSEFYSQGVSEYELNIFTKQQNKKNAGLISKITDISMIFRAYMEYVHTNYLVTDESLDILAGLIDGTDYFDKAKIWIDEFYTFTPQELKVINELIKMDIDITITFPIKVYKKKGLDLTLENLDPFFEPKLSILKINEMLYKNERKKAFIVFLYDTVRFRQSGALYFLSENYLVQQPETYLLCTDEITIFARNSKYEEMQKVAELIIRLVRDEGYKYNDIAIISNDMTVYGHVLENVFINYDIPIFMDTKKSIQNKRLSVFIKSVTEVIIHSFRYESIFKLLKTGFSKISAQDIYALENYVIEYGIQGNKWINNPWVYGASKYKKNELDRFNELREEIVEILKPVMGLNLNKNSVKDFVYKLFNFVTAVINRNDTMMATKEERQIYNIIVDVLNDMSNILGEQVVNFKEFADILYAGIESVDMGFLPRKQDEVICCDLKRSRVPTVKALFIIGLNEGGFALDRTDNTLITDDDREILEDYDILSGTSVRSRLYEEDFIIYNALTRASSKLYLSYSKNRLSGKELLPHSLLNKIKKIIKNVNIIDDNKLEISSASSMLPVLADILKENDTKLSGTEVNIYNWFRTNGEYREVMTAMDFEKGKTNIKSLSKENIVNLYGKHIRSSVSRMESYARCPFSYFLKYNMQCLPRKLYEIKSVDIGNIFHSVLEITSKEFLNKRKAPEDGMQSYISNVIDNSITNDMFAVSYKNSYILERIKKISTKISNVLIEHMEQSEFDFYMAEAELDMIVNDDISMSLSGRVDRLDILRDSTGIYIKLIDYKLSDRDFNFEDLEMGIQLQLFIYMSMILNGAIKEFDKDVLIPAAMFYFHISEPIIDYKDKNLADNFKLTGLLLDDIDIIKKMDKQLTSLPVKLNKSGGLYKTSKALSKEDMLRILDTANSQVKKIGSLIHSGDISAIPFKNKRGTACEYCIYSHICGLINSRSKIYNVINNEKSDG